MTELPTSVVFDDDWKMYEGPLDSHFYKSINYIQGYTKKEKVRYNSDGTIDKRKSNLQKGTSTYVEGLTKEEVDLIIEYLINKINDAENDTQEQIRFRNLVMFVLGVNLPIKSNSFLALKYKDLFDQEDQIKSIEMEMGRFNQNDIIYIPLKEVAKKVLCAYTKHYGLSYVDNSEDNLFESRKHQIVSQISWGRILKEASTAVGIDKNIGAESVRKTFGFNIFNDSPDKLEALLFLGEIWGAVREAKVIKYLNLSEKEVEFEYYLGETFSIGNVDLKKIHCLQRKPSCQKQKKVCKPKAQTILKVKKTNRLWTVEKKLEIVEKNLVDGVPQKILAADYDVDAGAISRWISSFKQYGRAGLEDKRYKI